jgi:hypothetical protein
MDARIYIEKRTGQLMAVQMLHLGESLITLPTGDPTWQILASLSHVGKVKVKKQ